MNHDTSILVRVGNRNRERDLLPVFPPEDVNSRMKKKKPRIAFYSHDTMGMGHIRRNILIAGHLSSDPISAETLLIAGNRDAAFFAEQAGLDCVTLPALRKGSDGQYAAKYFPWSLQETTQLRSRVIASTLLAFQPDIFVVDKLPQGICDELLRTLRMVRRRFETRCVLGLRDILDAPQASRREWREQNNDQIIEQYFDEVWVYGDAALFDCCAEYNFPESTRSKLSYVGYLDQRQRLRPQAGLRRQRAMFTRNNQEQLVLCVVGGGQDGFELAANFLQAGVPTGWRGIVITGPFMPEAQIQSLYQHCPSDGQFSIIDSLVEADAYIESADRVVCMGGYNTVASVLSFQKPALIVPRVRPREEQLVRAERLAAAGIASYCHPVDLSAAAIRQWLETSDVPVPKLGCTDLGGLAAIERQVSSGCSSEVAI
ncbi:glycosyltransferase family protein [Planctomycetaceae bacterium SH139]